MRLTIDVHAGDGDARAGTIRTPRGELPTPLFMPVGTKAAVKTLEPPDLHELGVPLILANTYHLMLRPGAATVASLGGLHRFMGWNGHVVTDSGGFQVFSLAPAVTEEGAIFRSTYDGSRHHLSPEGAVAVQEQLGADISMVLDVCVGLPAPAAVIRDAVDRTARWAGRARAAFVAGAGPRSDRGLRQSQFGIVQGGIDPILRCESAQRTAELEFDGYAVGGLSVGEPRHEMVPALAAALEELPADQPRYLMGVGDPASLVEAVGLGVDMFDCVLPTRHARHGTILTDSGRYQLSNARFAADPEPLDPACCCPVCARWSRGYLRHLLQVGEPSAGRLLTIHNLSWTLGLMGRMGEAIRAGTFAALRAEVLAVWG